MKTWQGWLAISAAALSGCVGGYSSPPTESHATAQTLTVAGPEKPAPAPVAVASANPAPASPAVAPSLAAPSNDGMNDVVAKVNGVPITMRQLVDPLIESHGLTMLVNLVELELAQQNAAKYKVTVTQKDLDEEHDRTLEKLFKDSDDQKLNDALDKAVNQRDAAEEARIRAAIKAEREDYLAQFLINQHIDRVEFNIVLKTNAYLRKILESDWKDKIKEEDVRNAFGQMYGERVRVRYILLDNMNEVGEAQRRLKSGDKFQDVARDMSHDPLTAPLGGMLEPFSREVREDRVAPGFREAAFALKDGQISDVVTLKSKFALIQRIEGIAPVAVKYEKVRDVVYKKLYDALMEAGLKAMKRELAIEAHKEMRIINPVLKQQVEENARRQAEADKKAKEELDHQQQLRDALKSNGAAPSETQPSKGTAPATGAATGADLAPAGERPPATGPGPGAHSFQLPRLGPATQPTVLPDVNQ